MIGTGIASAVEKALDALLHLTAGFMEKIEHEGLALIIFPTVYNPADDSFLLAKWAAKLARGNVLEMGSACGIVSLSVARADAKNEVTGLDINPQAVECAKENAKRNGIGNAHFLQSDMFSAVAGQTFHWIVFNPPYLPTTNAEKLRDRMENAAYDGGKTGREVIDRFLAEFDAHLREDGGLLLLSSSLANTEKTIKMLEKKGFEAKMLEEEKFFFEKIEVLMAKRKPENAKVKKQ
jgi:release factor glutamine methyltransferase